MQLTKVCTQNFGQWENKMAKNKVTIQIYGSGAETIHVALSKEAWEWWNDQDNDMLTEYTLSDEDEDYDFEVPKFADFLDGGAVYDSEGVVDHYWRIGYDAGTIEIAVNGKSIFGEEDYTMVNEVVIGDAEDPDEVNIRYDTTWTDDEQEIRNEIRDKKYMLTYESLEKGNFIDTEFEIDEDFDKSKLTVYTAEDWQTSEDKIADLRYDGTELENEGGDSTGKGIDVCLWKSGE
jgi:hypothetical protein